MVIARGCVHTTAQDGGHTPANRFRHATLVYTSYLFDVGHPCYDQLTPVNTRYMLTVSRDHIAGSSLELIEVTCFFFSWPQTKYSFCLDRGLMSGYLVEIIPELFGSRLMPPQDYKKVNRSIIKWFFFSEDLEIIQTQNRKAKQHKQKTSRHKFTKLKSKFSLILGQLNRAFNNPAQKLRF